MLRAVTGEQLAFGSAFEQLTGHPPFPWQCSLYERFIARDIPVACDIPTGLGKTAVIAVWVLALAAEARVEGTVRLPRRLVYVVNRRTVVDQATDEARHLRDHLASSPALVQLKDALARLAAFPCDAPLAISTLRGELADNREWRDDPARPAIVIGTADMIGSRLLFSGYGCGFKSRPLHAGFLGHDVLLVHDESHLEPAFQRLLEAIVVEQRRSEDQARLTVMELTATRRSDAGDRLALSDRDYDHPVVIARVHAGKHLALHPVATRKDLVGHILRRALEYRGSDQAVLVFVHAVDDAYAVARGLRAQSQACCLLTGTQRGLERDALADADPVFARFRPQPPATAAESTVYLVCTSAGEVGVNISADHLVCDLTTLDSMAQRVGRVNRFGRSQSLVDVFYEQSIDTPDDPLGPFDSRRQRTLELLRQLPETRDGRRAINSTALASLSIDARLAAFAPPPAVLRVDDVLFDAWAMTSIRVPWPGRPAVEEWLHGVSAEPPQTSVAWRQEVDELTPSLRERYAPVDLLEDYPLKPHESLKDQTFRVRKALETIAGRHGDRVCWIVDAWGGVDVHALSAFARGAKQIPRLAGCTVVLGPSVGGLDCADGTLDGDSQFDPARADRYDVADMWTVSGTERMPRRVRVRGNGGPPAGMRLVRTLDLAEDTDEADPEEPSRYWRWYVRPRAADDDGSLTALVPMDLELHLTRAERLANVLSARLGLEPAVAAALQMAARWHDRGKSRALWQRAVGNTRYPAVTLAKSGSTGFVAGERSPYRHELGSVLDMLGEPEVRGLPPEVRELATHMVAAHHGRGRPHFPADEWLDPDRSETEVARAALEVQQRFARLQRAYGRWGLAYLESLLRAVDAVASGAEEAGV